MKRIIIVFALACLSVATSAQINYKQPKDRLAVLDKDFGVYFFHIFPNHFSGTVYLKDGRTTIVRMNYDMERTYMSFVQANNTLGILSTENIAMITIEPFAFYPVGKEFGEVISRGAGCELLICRKIKRQSMQRDSYGKVPATASTSHDAGHIGVWIDGSGVDPNTVDYTKQDRFFLRYQARTFPFNERTLRSKFPDRYEEIKAFAKVNKLKYTEYEDVYQLFEFIIEPSK